MLERVRAENQPDVPARTSAAAAGLRRTHWRRKAFASGARATTSYKSPKTGVLPRGSSGWIMCSGNLSSSRFSHGMRIYTRMRQSIDGTRSVASPGRARPAGSGERCGFCALRPGGVRQPPTERGIGPELGLLERSYGLPSPRKRGLAFAGDDATPLRRPSFARASRR